MITPQLVVPPGVLSWNLPSSIHYEAGTPLHMELVVSNPTLLPREYSLHLQVARNGEVVEERVITVNDATSFLVIGNGQTQLYGEETIGISNATLSISLYDLATEQYVSSVSTQLYSGLIAPAFPWEKVFTGFAGVLIFAVVTAAVMRISKSKKEK